MNDATPYGAVMVAARKLPPRAVTVAAFLDWNPDDRSGALWQLRDGEPEMTAPASDAHGSVQSELGRLIGNHLVETGRPCRAVTNPGVVPPVRSEYNMLVPDLGVTCSPPAGHAIAEALRRLPDGTWPAQAEHIAADGALRLDSIGLAVPLRAACRTTNL